MFTLGSIIFKGILHGVLGCRFINEFFRFERLMYAEEYFYPFITQGLVHAIYAILSRFEELNFSRGIYHEDGKEYKGIGFSKAASRKSVL